jgi:hypothetical protein
MRRKEQRMPINRVHISRQPTISHNALTHSLVHSHTNPAHTLSHTNPAPSFPSLDESAGSATDLDAPEEAGAEVQRAEKESEELQEAHFGRSDVQFLLQ